MNLQVWNTFIHFRLQQCTRRCSSAPPDCGWNKLRIHTCTPPFTRLQTSLPGPCRGRPSTGVLRGLRDRTGNQARRGAEEQGEEESEQSREKMEWCCRGLVEEARARACPRDKCCCGVPHFSSDSPKSRSLADRMLPNLSALCIPRCSRLCCSRDNGGHSPRGRNRRILVRRRTNGTSHHEGFVARSNALPRDS